METLVPNVGHGQYFLFCFSKEKEMQGAGERLGSGDEWLSDLVTGRFSSLSFVGSTFAEPLIFRIAEMCTMHSG